MQINDKMKKKKILFLIVVTICVIITGVLVYKPLVLSSKLTKLDKTYNNLSEFELEAPFDINVIESYQIRGFSTTSHTAIDFFGVNSVASIPILALKDCVIIYVKTYKMLNQGTSENWVIDIKMLINSDYQIHLGFETFSNTYEAKKLQQSNIFVKVGDVIKQGDLIGNLIINTEGTHVHFDITKKNDSRYEQFVIPEPYFSENSMVLLNDAFRNPRNNT